MAVIVVVTISGWPYLGSWKGYVYDWVPLSGCPYLESGRTKSVIVTIPGCPYPGFPESYVCHCGDTWLPLI